MEVRFLHILEVTDMAKKCKRKNLRKVRKPTTNQIKQKRLRSGSSEIKRILLAINPHCDICGSGDNLQLHHVYLIRHGFKSRIDRCVLLCPQCHHAFHKRWDHYLDAVYRERPETDFMRIYQILKGSLN